MKTTIPTRPPFLTTLSIPQLDRLNERIWKQMNYGNCGPLAIEHPHFLQILDDIGDTRHAKWQAEENTNP